MTKRMLNAVELNVKFGNKGVFPVKGIVKTIGESESGRKWFSLLVAKKRYSNTLSGNRVSEYFFVERTFLVESLADEASKKSIEVLFSE